MRVLVLIHEYPPIGGGGGRVAVYYTDAGGFDVSNRVHATGGQGYNDATDGAAGTIYLEDRAGGRTQLRVDNEAVGSLGYYHLTIVRPSLLLGERSEFRFGEEVAKRFAFLLPRSYRPISARMVAAALVRAARSDQRGKYIIENRTLHRPTAE